MSEEARCLACSCNGVFAPAADLPGQVGPVARALCRGDVGVFRAAAAEAGPLVVGCTQEAAFFRELAGRLKAPAELRFIDLRDLAGRTEEGANADPKMAAMVVMAGQSAPPPVAAVEFESSGSVLIIGPAEAALDWAARLAESLDVSVLATGGAALPARREFPVWTGREVTVCGHLGAFDVSWREDSAIDPERCVGCGKCVTACLEHAITMGGASGVELRLDLSACRRHGDCVKACGDVAAIDFGRLSAPPRSERFDLVFDLSRRPLLTTPHLPDGYFAPGADPLAQSEAARRLPQLVGSFERPRFLSYSTSRCAHQRGGKTGCTRCIDICSTSALSSRNGIVEVDAYLCAGCGGCATVCPTGAARYAYPAPSVLMKAVRRGLAAYRRAGGHGACLLVYGPRSRDALPRLAREGRGLPARVIPLEVHDIAAYGLDLALASLCFGAAQVRVLIDDEEADSYVEALRTQYDIGNVILAGLGYGLGRLGLIEGDTLAASLASLPAPQADFSAATFDFPDHKREAFDFVFAHLAAHAPTPRKEIALAAGAPFGAVAVDSASCTLCMACVGACPAGALLDTADAPRLRFIERNCVQCGLCRESCPENAITLVPRLVLSEAARKSASLNETRPFHCVSCGAPFGGEQLVRAMLERLSGHGVYADDRARRRLQMCSDCRVKDLFKDGEAMSVLGERR